MKHKILYITLHPDIGGGETSLFYLLENLDRNKFEPEVIVTNKGQVYSRLKEIRVKAHIIDLPGYTIRLLFLPGTSPLGVYNLFKLAQEVKPSLIHINQPTLAVYAGTVSKLLKIPVVATAHGFWDSIYFYQDLINNLFLDKIIANSPRLKKTLTKRKILSPGKIEAIPFGIDTKRFKPTPPEDGPGSANEARQTLKIHKDKLVVTVVGRLDPQKDYLNFFNAATIIGAKLPKARFYIVGSKKGDFSETNYADQISKYLKQNPKLKQKVKWAGFVENMPTVYQATDILVMPSAFEGFPLTLLEAASSKLPIVATNSGSVDLIVKNNKNGYLIPPENPKKLAEKVIKLGKDRKLREEFGEEGRKHIVKNFTIQKYAEAVEKVYLSLL